MYVDGSPSLPLLCSPSLSTDLICPVFLQLGLPVLAVIVTSLLKMWWRGEVLRGALMGAYTMVYYSD